MLSRRAAFEAAVREPRPGLLEIGVVRRDDGAYPDVPLWWDSRAAADTAIERYAAGREAGYIHAFVEEVLAHHRGEVAVA
jgi:hypothetical protein